MGQPFILTQLMCIINITKVFSSLYKAKYLHFNILYSDGVSHPDEIIKSGLSSLYFKGSQVSIFMYFCSV